MKPSYSTILPSLVESSIVLSSLFHIVMEIISRKNLSPLLNKTKNPSNSQSVDLNKYEQYIIELEQRNKKLEQQSESEKEELISTLAIKENEIEDLKKTIEENENEKEELISTLAIKENRSKKMKMRKKN